MLFERCLKGPKLIWKSTVIGLNAMCKGKGEELMKESNLIEENGHFCIQSTTEVSQNSLDCLTWGDIHCDEDIVNETSTFIFQIPNPLCLRPS